ncbi:MAG: putative nucleotide-diphospho-sugar transferase [Cyanobacteriota bacterium]
MDLKIDPAMQGQPVVVTFANRDYVHVTRNWLHAIMKVRVKATIRIIALDQESRDEFPPEHTQYHPFSLDNLSSFWAFRIKILREILEEASAIIHSDSDAVWLKNPLPLIDKCKSDMVFSQGTVWPPDVHVRHGIVLCCGFFYIRRTNDALKFLSSLEKRAEVDGDDQVSLNRIVSESGIEWIVGNPYQIPFRDTFFTASHEIIYSKAGGPISIAILLHHTVARQIDAIKPCMVVAHPLSDKTGADKKAILSNLGLWNLPISEE